MTWEKYTHIIEHIEADAGVIRNIPAWLKSKRFTRPLIVCDTNTYRVAGQALCTLLDNASQPYDLLKFPHEREELVADEQAIGALMAAYAPEKHDLFIAVGSGTLNDLCKYVSYKVNKPFIIVGTAPSMDGYASAGAAMTLGGLKVTPQTHGPLAIFCDTDIIKNAPMIMTAAGLGDILGKINALADWRLSHLLTGEPMPADIVKLVDDAVTAVSSSVDAAKARDGGAIRLMTEGLILSGLAMTLYGDSRPASGTEHHLAHYWEMRFLAEGRAPVAHGLKVGVAALCALRLWKALPEMPSAPKTEDRAAILSLVREKYGSSALDLLKTENPNILFADIQAAWPQIRAIADNLPDPDEVEALLLKLDAPIKPAAVGVHELLLEESILLARERKKTYTLLQLLGDLGLLESAGKALAADFARRALEKVKLLVLDMDGTIYLGDQMFPFTPKFLEDIQAHGKEYVFFTNNSSKNKEAYLKKLERMGLLANPEKFYMSTQVILEFLKAERPGQTVWAAGTPDMLAQFTAAGIDPQSENPDIAVIGFDQTLTYAKLLKIQRALENGAELLGVHEDLVCPMPDGSIPDCGAMMKIFTSIWNREAEFFGKPSRRTLDFLLRHTGCQEEELCFVGDRLYTDIAVAAGTKAVSILVLSGESRAEDLARYPGACPDRIVGDISEIFG